MSSFVLCIAHLIQKYFGQFYAVPIPRRFGLVIVLAAAAFILTSIESSAHFYPKVQVTENGVTKEYDAPDYLYARRRLCYVIADEMANNTTWSSWVNQAINNWNSVSSDTGWEFHPCAEGERPNVRFGFADATTDGTSASSGFGPGTGSTANEEFHVYILRNATGIIANGIKVSGGLNGWSDRGATTLDAVLVIMHEMTHAMRLDHKPGSGWDTGNLEEPIGAGNHNKPVKHRPSATDIAQASASATNNKLPPTVSYKLPVCPDDGARKKAMADLDAMLKTAQKQYDDANAVLTPRAKGFSESDLEYRLYREQFPSQNADAKNAAAKALTQALSNIEYIQGLLSSLDGKKPCPPPATTTPSHSSRITIPEGPMQSGSEGFYVGLGGGGRSTVCDNWRTKQVESTPGVDDPIGENPDACFSTAARASIYFGYTWTFRDNWMAGIEADVGYANANTTKAGIPGTVGSIVSTAGSLNDSVNVKETWDGSFRGRLGYKVTPATTMYGTVGLAWQRLEATITCGGGTGICGSAGLAPFSASNSTTRLGWTLGGGAEMKLWQDWLARAEYRYSDYGTYTATYGTRTTLGITSDIALRTHTMLIGVAKQLGR